MLSRHLQSTTDHPLISLDPACRANLHGHVQAQSHMTLGRHYVMGFSRNLQEDFPAAYHLRSHLTATFCRTERKGAKLRIKYTHAPFEHTSLPDASCDLVTASFVIHECPPPAIRDLIKEARRLVRPGGVLMLADNNPR